MIGWYVEVAEITKAEHACLKFWEHLGLENRLPRRLFLAGGDGRDDPEGQCGEHTLNGEAGGCIKAPGLSIPTDPGLL